jgi:hypothetical protein
MTSELRRCARSARIAAGCRGTGTEPRYGRTRESCECDQLGPRRGRSGHSARPTGAPDEPSLTVRAMPPSDRPIRAGRRLFAVFKARDVGSTKDDNPENTTSTSRFKSHAGNHDTYSSSWHSLTRRYLRKCDRAVKLTDSEKKTMRGIVNRLPFGCALLTCQLAVSALGGGYGQWMSASFCKDDRARPDRSHP